MRILSWNVNGIRAVQKKGFLDWFKKESPDVLCLQETKAEADQLDDHLKNVEGYCSFWCSAERRGYSGVSIYARPEARLISNELGPKELDAEGRILALDLERFVLFNVYFPNGGAGNARVPFKLAFYDFFLKKIEKLRRKGRHVIVCGDVNTAHAGIDLSRPKENEKNTGFLPEERAWITKLIGHGYVDTFRHFHKEGGHYSWWDYKTRARERNVGWRIDYFFVNEEFLPQVKDAFILSDVQGSDHCPVGIEVKNFR